MKIKSLCFSIVVVSFLTLLQSCSVNKAKIDNELKKYFDEKNVDGCFTMLNNATGEVTVYNMALDTAKATPGATFDLFNAMVALEIGSLSNENETIHFDSATVAQHPGLKDLTVKEAFQNNQSLFFDSIARKTGTAKMQEWLKKVAYGSQQIGKDTLRYWQNNVLKISPDEQLGLLEHMYFNKLSFRNSVQESMKNIMVRESNGTYSLAYHLSAIPDGNGKQNAWVIGWIEENKHVYFFVTYIKGANQDVDANKNCLDITKTILSKYGFFKGEK